MRLTDFTKNYDEATYGKWKTRGYVLPNFDRKAVKASTYQEPTWVHFGAGNIFRAFPAVELQKLLDEGIYEKGVVVCEAFDTEIIEKAYKPFDGMSLSVVLKSDGTIEKQVVGSVVEPLVADHLVKEDYLRIEEVFRSPSLQMVSFTITEKGYCLTNASGQFFPEVEGGFQKGPGGQQNIMGKITELLYLRYQAGQYPIAMVSMDNCSHNGDKLKTAILTFAKEWSRNGLVGEEFLTYLDRSGKVSYPWSMIDKITPRPDETVKSLLEKDGFEDTELIITSRDTYTAPFVNSEETGYLVIEDAFPNGRPPLEKTGILFTDRETVDKVEKMKVCTCLNPLHTALAVFGCLLSYPTIHEEMEDEDLRELVKRIGYIEGMPVVVDPDIINPNEFLDTVLQLRLPNPFMPDSPWRIVTDTSQKIPIRFGETIKAYARRMDLDPKNLIYIPLTIAGWFRYLLGVDDEGRSFVQSPDPLLNQLTNALKGVKIGEPIDAEQTLRSILKDKAIFGVDLYEVGLAEKIKGMFLEMISKPGAVRETLNKYLNENHG